MIVVYVVIVLCWCVKNVFVVCVCVCGVFMVKLCVDSFVFDVDAATFWRARTTLFFMMCECVVFGDLERFVVLYEWCRYDENCVWCVI